MDGVSLAASLTDPALCPELDAFNETGIWITDDTRPARKAPALSRSSGIDGSARPRERHVGDSSCEYHDIIMNAKDRMIRRGPWKLVSQPLADGSSNDAVQRRRRSRLHTGLLSRISGNQRPARPRVAGLGKRRA